MNDLFVNAYKTARINAGLKRDPAAEELHICARTLDNYESLDWVGIVPCDIVVSMAKLYQAPHLLNYHCTRKCSIGEINVPKLEMVELDRATLKILSALKASNIDYIKETLIDITADGIITGDEKLKLNSLLEMLELISKNTQELMLWAQKSIKGNEVVS